MKKIFASLLLVVSTSSVAGFISPVSVTSLHSPYYGSTNNLISDAVDTGYVAPNPASGGVGTSTWVNSAFNTWVFDLASANTLNEAYIWDYYGHSATDWTLVLFDDFGGAGTNLGQVDFSFVTAPTHTSGLHTVAFASVDSVRSVTLTNSNTSVRGGIGLSEVAFNNVPEPSTVLLLGVGLLGFAGMRKKAKSA